MITYGFDFFAPSSTAEALDLLAEHGEAARVLAGGMSLMPIMNLGLASPEVLVSLNHLDDLSHVEAADGRLRLGAMVRHARLVTDETVAAACPSLAEAAAVVGDVQVRNRGTIGGSVAHADPAADYLPVLVAAGASVVVRSAAGERVIPMRELLVGIMETQVQPGELLAEVSVPALPRDGGSAYVRLARVEGSFAIANAAVVATPQGVTLSVGGVNPVPLVAASDRAPASEAEVDEWVGDALRALLPAADGDAEARYKNAMALVCARRAAAAALRTMAGA